MAKAKPKSGPKVPVSRRALVRRINRMLAHREETLIMTRGARAREEFGEFYIMDLRSTAILATGFDGLEAAGREYGVLRAWETMVEDER